MFSRLVSFFAPKKEDNVRKEDMDLLVETVSKGFSAHKGRLDSIEAESAKVVSSHAELSDRIERLSSSVMMNSDMGSKIEANSGQIASANASIGNLSSKVSDLDVFARESMKDLISYVNALEDRLSKIESCDYVTRSALYDVHESLVSDMDKRIDENVSGKLPGLVEKEVSEKVSDAKAGQAERHPPQAARSTPKEISKDLLDDIDGQIDISALTVLEKNILKTLVELRLKSGVATITITDLTNKLYPGSDSIRSKRPTVSSYVSKLALSGFLVKERKNNSVFVSINKDKVIDYFAKENYSHLKKVI